MNQTRRNFLGTVGAVAAGVAVPRTLSAFAAGQTHKTHIITLSFDDGFKRSSILTAEIFEKYKLSACINVIATGHLKEFQIPDEYQVGIPKGDFELWNQLQARGHEIMPHGFKHANKAKLPLEEAKDLIRRCLVVFKKELKGFDQKTAVFNFPYNASTPALEAWLSTQVMAFRTGGGPFNAWPHAGQVKLRTGGSGGPENCERKLDREIDAFLAGPSGWFLFNLHGLDHEGWGPIRAEYLDGLLKRLTAIETLDLLPAGRALMKYAARNR